jgi:hypothetical protein
VEAAQESIIMITLFMNLMSSRLNISSNFPIVSTYQLHIIFHHPLFYDCLTMMVRDDMTDDDCCLG